MRHPGDARTQAASQEGAAHLDFITGQRSDAEFKRAKNHTRRVKFLKIFMPVMGLLIIMALLGAFFIRQIFTPNIDIGAIALEDGKLVMENPNLSGVDANSRPFNLSATRALQDADQPKRVELIKIDARLPIDDTNFADIRAGNGIYDADAKTLQLYEKVKVNTSDGMRINLEDADIDIAIGRLITEKPVTANSEQADISSERLLVEENGDRLVFEGKVRMTLRPKQDETQGQEN